MRYSNRGPVEFFRSNELSSTPFSSQPRSIIHALRLSFFAPFLFSFLFLRFQPLVRPKSNERRKEGRREGTLLPPLRVDRFASRRERYRDQNPDPVFQKIVGPSPSLSPSPSLFISPPPPVSSPRERGRHSWAAEERLLEPRLLFVHGRFIFRVRRIINLGWA